MLMLADSHSNDKGAGPARFGRTLAYTDHMLTEQLNQYEIIIQRRNTV